MGEIARRPEFAVADAVDAGLDLFLDVSAMAGVTLAAITTGSVISAPASRAGMSAQPLGGGKRPTCEVLIRVRLRRMFPSSLVSAFDPGHDHTTDIAIEPVAALTP